MAYNKQKKSPSFSFFGIFKARKPRGEEDSYDDAKSTTKIYPSDSDKSHCVADRKLSVPLIKQARVMAYNKQRKSPSFSFFSIFKARKPRREDDSYDDAKSTTKIYPSDSDKSHYVADRKVDIKAGVYIERIHTIHKNNLVASESQTMGGHQSVTVYQDEKA
uniref:Uncharacterized protein n=1 Tax=Quercus lobata TaxID=97700 RepID=A0A7N2R0T6_QUELO